MSDRLWAWDTVQLDASKIEETDDELIFKDVVLVREIVHVYNDGRAYKPADELEAAYWTLEGRWSIAGSHPTTGLLMNRDDIQGKTTNIRFVKNLINPKTRRPMDRGILGDLHVFKNRVDPSIVADLKAGKKKDVSIGFLFDKDGVPGTVPDGSLKGTEYDYAQRKFMFDHTAYALEKGRCPMPFCGIGADELALDPFAGYKTFNACIKDIMKQNPDYTREQAAATCAEIEKRSKEKHKSDMEKVDEMKALKQAMSIIKDVLEEDDVMDTTYLVEAMDMTVEEIETKITELKDTRNKLRKQLNALYEKTEKPATEGLWEKIDDLNNEIKAYQEAKVFKITEVEKQDGPRTEAERAKAHFKISDEDWEKLSDEEKKAYIDKLPERGKGGEDEDEEKEWWTTYDWNANPEVYYVLPEEGKEAIVAMGLWDATAHVEDDDEQDQPPADEDKDDEKFDMEASRRVTEKARKRLKELGIK